MDEKFEVIYVAGSLEQAAILKNALVDLGMPAHVVNDAVQSTAGELTGWPAAARVAVREQDAEDARRIALAYDRARKEGASQTGQDEDQAESEDDAPWPRCPSCGRPRLATCPVCETAGTDFHEAYHPDVNETEVPDTSGTSTADQRGLVVICPTCDEPFSPRFPVRCEWCGYRFADGVEPSAQPAPPPASDFNVRVVVAIVGLLVTVSALVAFFATVVNTR